MGDEFDISALERLQKILKQETLTIRIGVSDEGLRTDGKTNTEIGTAHEYGAPAQNLPMRSFLRIPLLEKMDDYLERSGLLDEDTLKEVLKTGTTKAWAKSIAKIGKKVVDDAFATEGFGQWVAHSPNYQVSNKILDQTGQLRRSIVSEVIDAK